jgi:hypothetical protein
MSDPVEETNLRNFNAGGRGQLSLGDSEERAQMLL